MVYLGHMQPCHVDSNRYGEASGASREATNANGNAFRSSLEPAEKSKKRYRGSSRVKPEITLNPGSEIVKSAHAAQPAHGAGGDRH